MIGGLLGGLIGGGAAWLALTYLVPPHVGTELQALHGQIEQLDGRVQQLQGKGPALAQLDSRMQALEQASAKTSEQSQAGPALNALDKRVGALEHSVSANEAGASAKTLEDLQTRVAALENQLSGLATDVAGAGDARAGAVATLEALQSRLTALEGRLSEAGGGGALADRIDALGARIDALEPTGAKLEQLAGDVREVKNQTAATQERLGGLASQVDGLDQRLQALHGDVGHLQSQLADTQSRVAAAADRRELAAALALITSQIDTAVGRSQPYDAPLRSLTALGDRDEVVRKAAADLAPSASTGVPTLAALRQSFATAADEIVQRARAPEGKSLLDKAASNLMRLVTVRPVGAKVEGEDAAARVARAEADLGQGDLAAAVAELEALKGPAAEAAADWLAEAKTRLRTTQALARLQAHTTDLLTHTTN